MLNRRNEGDAPSPEKLHAFLDGELSAPERADVADWLARHPEAARDLEEYRKLDQVWHTNPPPEPDEQAWGKLLHRIRGALEPAANGHSHVNGKLPLVRPMPRPTRPSASRRWLLPAIVAVAVAAGVLVAVLALLPRNGQPGTNDQSALVLPCAHESDVEIVSLDASDSHLVVVGALPLGEFNLVEPGDVVIVKVDPDQDGMIPNAQLADAVDGPMPMIHVPLDHASTGGR